MCLNLERFGLTLKTNLRMLNNSRSVSWCVSTVLCAYTARTGTRVDFRTDDPGTGKGIVPIKRGNIRSTQREKTLYNYACTHCSPMNRISLVLCFSLCSHCHPARLESKWVCVVRHEHSRRPPPESAFQPTELARGALLPTVCAARAAHALSRVSPFPTCVHTRNRDPRSLQRVHTV